MNVQDHRTTARYLTEPPLRGVVGKIDVSICNVAEGGLQVEHHDPLIPHQKCTLAFSLPGGRDAFALTGTVIWSRIFRSGGRYLYRSGIRLDEGGPALGFAVQTLVRSGVARPDDQSLERKKQSIHEKSNLVAGQMFVRPAVQALPSFDEVARIREAVERLLSSPGDLSRWSRLGRSSLRGGFIAPKSSTGNSADLVVAVWEYLDHEIELRLIANALENLGGKSVS